MAEEVENVNGTLKIVIYETDRKHSAEDGRLLKVFLVREYWVPEGGLEEHMRDLMLAANNREEVEEVYRVAILDINPEAECYSEKQYQAPAGEGIN